MSVKDTLFGRLELAVADNVCIRNGSRSNIGVQAYNTYQYKTRHVLINRLKEIFHRTPQKTCLSTHCHVAAFKI
jgi:uroporphyrinogen-III decarboxylase